MKDSFKLKGEYKIITTKAGTNEVLRETPWQTNKIVANGSNGMYAVLDALAGVATTIELKYMAIGDDNTAAAATDTALGNELVRAVISKSSTTRSGLTVTFKAFFPDGTTTNTTYYECGCFIGGSSTLGSGNIFNRIIFSSPLVKAAGEDNTIVYRVTASV